VTATTELGGVRVLVTGASSGLGAAMARALAEAGARVMVTSRDLDRAQATAAELGSSAIPYQLDVRGLPGRCGDEVVGCFLVARAVVPVMLADGGGRIVNISMNTRTGMLPDDVPAEVGARLQDPAAMGPPIVWLASADATGVHDRAHRGGRIRLRSNRKGVASVTTDKAPRWCSRLNQDIP
jgi:hypothetical protein